MLQYIVLLRIQVASLTFFFSDLYLDLQHKCLNEYSTGEPTYETLALLETLSDQSRRKLFFLFWTKFLVKIICTYLVIHLSESYDKLFPFVGDKSSTDWDKAWSSFRKQSKKNFFSQFSPNKYVTWNPKRSEYPLSEEVDPIKRAEKSNLMLWTSPQFTLVGAIIIVTFLLVYSILAITK